MLDKKFNIELTRIQVNSFQAMSALFGDSHNLESPGSFSYSRQVSHSFVDTKATFDYYVGLRQDFWPLWMKFDTISLLIQGHHKPNDTKFQGDR